ncbi:MAG: flagellar assembly protein [Micromonosporaceae bacterium]|nr:flagellar assembly protein [Micromonosporaceae bacterium]
MMTNSSHSRVTTFNFDIDLRRTAITADVPLREAAELAQTPAHAAGYAAGWAEGRRSAAAAAVEEAQRVREEAQVAARASAARIGQALAALASAATRLDQRATPGLAAVEQLVVDAVFTLAETVIGRELATAEDPGADAIARALAAAPANGPVTVYLHPGDLATIRETAGVSGQLTIAGRTVVVLPDPGLKPGDAVAECDTTTVDARIAPAVERIREVLLHVAA